MCSKKEIVLRDLWDVNESYFSWEETKRWLKIHTKPDGVFSQRLNRVASETQKELWIAAFKTHMEWGFRSDYELLLLSIFFLSPVSHNLSMNLLEVS